MQKEQTLKLVMKYLKQHNFVESYLTLQRQSLVRYSSLPREIQFFKKIMLKGDYNQCVKFLLTFQQRIEQKQYKRIMLHLYKQKLYELIENPDENELRNLFEKDIFPYCNQEQYQQLFSYLTYRSVNQIIGLQKWTILKGRYNCFEFIIPFLEVLNSTLKADSLADTDDDLQQIIASYYGGVKENKNQVNMRGSQIGLRKSKTANYMMEDQSEQSLTKSKAGQSEGKDKEIIKNSIVNMNLKSNLSSNLYQNPLQNNSQKKSDKISLNSIQNNSKKFIIDEREQSQSSSIQKLDQSNKLQQNNEKRSRVNASINLKEKGENSTVRIDNFVKEGTLNGSLDNEELSSSNYINPSQINSKTFIPNLSNLQQSKNIRKPLKIQEQQISQSSQIKETSQQQKTSERIPNKTKVEKGKYEYLNQKKQQEELEEEVKNNLRYLEQSGSVIYGDRSQLKQSMHKQFLEEDSFIAKVSKVKKLTSFHDAKAIRTCQFTDSGDYFAVGTNSSIVKIFDVKSLLQKQKYQDLDPQYQIDNLHSKSIFSLNWSSNERSLVTCSNDLYVKYTEFNESFSDHKTTLIGKHDSCVRMVKIMPSQTKIVSCGDDGLIKVWDLGKIKKCSMMKGHNGSVSGIKIGGHGNENQIVSVGKDFTVRKWDLRMGQNALTSSLQSSQLTYISSNTPKIITSHKNGNVSFFSPSLELEYSVQIHDEEIRSVQALQTPGEELLATSSFDGNVAIFSQKNIHQPFYYEHNDNKQDKVVFAGFKKGGGALASSSTLGVCSIYQYE